MKLAMFGGSFDPVHKNHVDLCKTMIKNFSLDKVIVFPAACSPFKNSAYTADIHRLNMCRLAFENCHGVEVSDFELKKGGKSYTVDTLRFLRESYKDAELYLITGADAFLTIDSWYKSEEIFKLANILTVVREDDDVNDLKLKSEELQKLGASAFFLDTSIGSVSSTKVRKALSCGSDVSSFLDIKVIEYIKKNGLYGYAD